MKKKLNILHTVSNNQWGGQERRVYNECRWMNQKGHAITIITPKDTPLYKKSKTRGWQTHGIEFKKHGILGDFFKIKSILKDFKPDVLNTHGNMDAKLALTAARKMNIPCVILSRHITPAVNNTWYNRLLYTKLCTYVFTTADCTTRQIIQDLGVPEDRAFTISSGIIPPQKKLSRQTAREKIARELDQDANTRYIGYIGRFDPAKGLMELLQAFAQIKNHIPEYRLVMVGQTIPWYDLKKKAKELGVETLVFFTGYKKDPWPYYRAFDCKVLASRDNEGIAQSLLEAMFSGCPVIGTNVGGIPDIIKDQENGLITPPKDPTALASKLLKTIKDTKETAKRVKNASQFVSRNHTIDVMGEKILKLVEKALTQYKCFTNHADTSDNS
ncbi:MAG: glycosyltransferase family 4 protein [Desulfobacteraceae bacterium]|nr:glycosyltransferase family 4 protein [Desulfobacteraceae bacterium]